MLILASAVVLDVLQKERNSIKRKSNKSFSFIPSVSGNMKRVWNTNISKWCSSESEDFIYIWIITAIRPDWYKMS